MPIMASDPKIAIRDFEWKLKAMQSQIDACRARFDRLGAHLDRMKAAESKREKRRKI